jgi:hypothetical protein
MHDCKVTTSVILSVHLVVDKYCLMVGMANLPINVVCMAISRLFMPQWSVYGPFVLTQGRFYMHFALDGLTGFGCCWRLYSPP